MNNDVLQRLNINAKKSIKQIYHGIAEYSNIQSFCNELMNGIDYCLSVGDLASNKDEITSIFFKKSLPLLIDVLMKRPTSREDSNSLLKVFSITIQLLAQPICNEFVELCELRNHILTASALFKFVQQRDIEIANSGQHSMYAPGFFADYGKPELAIINRKPVHFWPKEWRYILGGDKALLHFLKVFVEGVWREGVVIDYEAESDSYLLLACDRVVDCATIISAQRDASSIHAPGSGGDGDGSGGDGSGSGSDVLRVSASIMDDGLNVQWTDLEHKAEIALLGTMQVSPRYSAFYSSLSLNSVLLDHNDSDIGLFLKTQFVDVEFQPGLERERSSALPSGSFEPPRPYFGRVIRYDKASDMHTLLYEDGQEVSTCLRPPNNVFELVFNIPDKVKASFAGKSHQVAIHFVAQWQLQVASKTSSKEASTSTGAPPPPNNAVVEENSPTEPLHISSANASQSLYHPKNKSLSPRGWECVVQRPPPSAHYGFGYIQADLIDLFYNEGGFDVLYSSLVESRDMHRAISVSCNTNLQMIVLQMRLLYHMRTRFSKDKLYGMIWELKEYVPLLTQQCVEYQSGDLQKDAIHQIVGGMKDLLNVVLIMTSEISGELDKLYFVLALKLLNSSQLQKRFMGLSLIRSQIEVVTPSVVALLHRLGVTYVNEFIQVPAKQSNISHLPQQQTTSRSPSSLDAEYVESILTNYNIFHVVFGTSVHQDLVLKCDVIIYFLAIRKSLLEDHITILWRSSLQTHEEVTRAIYTLILKVLPALSLPLRNFLFQLVASSPPPLVTEHYLRFVKNFTLISLRVLKDEGGPVAKGGESSHVVATSSGNRVSSQPASEGMASAFEEKSVDVRRGQVINAPPKLWMGFTVLWQFIQDNEVDHEPSAPQKSWSAAGESFTALAIELLVELLQEDEFADDKETILQKCIHNVKQRVSSVTSLRLMRLVLALYPTNSSGWFNLMNKGTNSKQSTSVKVSTLIDKMNKQESWLDHIFVDIEQYHLAFKGQMKCLLPGHDMRAVNDIRVVTNGKRSRLSHLDCMQERLEFIKFIICNSALVLTEDQVYALWRIYVMESDSHQVTDNFLSWLECLIARENKMYRAFLQHLSEQYCYQVLNNSEGMKKQDLTSLYKLTYGKFAIRLSSDEMSFGSDTSTDADSSKTSFASGAIRSLFENVICPATSDSSVGESSSHGPVSKYIFRPSVAKVCLKIFLYVNIECKSFKLENSGDGMIVNWTLSSAALVGIVLLWCFAVDVGSILDCAIYEASMYLLVEIYHRVVTKVRNADSTKGLFLKQCLSQISYTLQILRIQETDIPIDGDDALTVSVLKKMKEDEVVRCHESVLTAMQDTGKELMWYVVANQTLDKQILATRIRQFVYLMRIFVDRFEIRLKTYCMISVSVSATSFGSTFEFIISTYETVRDLKIRICDYFHVDIDAVHLYRVVKTSALLNSEGNSNFEKLEKETVSLKSLKFASTETISVRRVETKPNANQTQSSKTSDVENKEFGNFRQSDVISVKQVIENEDSKSTDMFPPNPFDWLGINLISPYYDFQFYTTKKNSSSEGKIKEAKRSPVTGVVTSAVFSLPASPLPYHSDMSLVLEGSDNVFAKSNITHGYGLEDKSAKLAEFVGPYLGSQPQYFEQLLEVLDTPSSFGRSKLSSEANATIDVSLAIWEIIQSLPAHVPMMQQITSLTLKIPESAPKVQHNTFKSMVMHSKFLDKMLNHRSPHTLLYTLQIIDSIIVHDLNHMTHSVLGLCRPVLEWSWRFILMGGCEHLVFVLRNILDLLGGRKSSNDFSDSFDDRKLLLTVIYSMCCSMIMRILHKLLLLDSDYSMWHIDLQKTYCIYPGEADTVIPPGRIMGVMDGSNLLRELVTATVEVTTWVFNNEKCVSSNLNSTMHAGLGSFIEHGVFFVHSLATALDNGVDILQCIPDYSRYLRAITLRVPSSGMRMRACRRLLESFMMIMLKCTETQFGVGQDRVNHRIMLFNFMQSTLFTSVQHKSSNIVEQYKKLQESKQANDIGSSQIFFNSAPTDSSSNNHDTEVNYLLAALLILHSRRDTLSELRLSSLSVDQHRFYEMLLHTSAATSSSDRAVFICEDIMVLSIVEKLVTHKSAEVFSSNDEVDADLVGILRSLICAMHNSSMELKQFIGSALQFTCENGSTSNLVTFLYNSCLFAADPANGGKSPNRRITGAVFHDVGASESVLTIGNSIAICQSKLSRNLAYDLLLQLCLSENRNLKILVGLMCKEDITLTSDGGLAVVEADLSANATPHKPVRDKFARRGPKRDSKAMKKIKKIANSLWEYDPSSMVRSKDAYMGLVNQGCTCYMNAFLQQLFHIPSFVQQFLSIGPGEEGGDGESSSEYSRRQSDVDLLDATVAESVNYDKLVMHELQILFSFLKLSRKKTFDTLKFCRSFLDYNNEPIKLSEQKDINEFASMLFEKMERSNSMCQKLLQYYFGGKIVNRIISLESDYRSEREEPFYILTIDVRNKRTVEESLQLYVTEEIMSGENKIEDNRNNTKVDASKGCCIRELPKILIIHLKRFEFDLETMHRRKVNDRLEFPLVLDMFPYCEAGLSKNHHPTEAPKSDRTVPAASGGGRDSADSNVRGGESVDSLTEVHAAEYTYHLKGIVAHSGAIDSGHYYSYIKDTAPNSSKWLEYNDSFVMPFNVESIPSECFGGKMDPPAPVSGGAVSASEIASKSNSAYMLFYEKRIVEKLDIPKKLVEENVESENATSSTKKLSEEAPPPVLRTDSSEQRSRGESISLQTDYEHRKHSSVVAMGVDSLVRSDSSLPSNGVMKIVLAENMEFLIDRAKFNSRYFAFQWSLLHSKLIADVIDSSSSSISDDSSVLGQPSSNKMLPPLRTEERQLLLVKQVYIAVQFLVEVVARGLASECIPIIIQRVEHIILKDSSGNCAFVLLSELSKDPVAYQMLFRDRTVLDTAAQKYESSIGYRDRTIHPWLLAMFVGCPHASTISLFAKLLITAIQSIKHLCEGKYLEVHKDLDSYRDVSGNQYSDQSGEVTPTGIKDSENPSSPSGDMVGSSDFWSTSKSSDLTLVRQTIEDRVESCNQYKCSVTRLIGKLLILMDSMRTDDVYDRKGYEGLTCVLLSFANSGSGERVVLLTYGAIYRIVCSVVVLQPVYNANPKSDVLNNSIELVSLLVQHATLPPDGCDEEKRVILKDADHEQRVKPRKHPPADNCVQMSPGDAEAFSARLFLESASAISARVTTTALCHYCAFGSKRHVTKIFNFLFDRITECLTMKPPRNIQSLKLHFNMATNILVSLCSASYLTSQGISVDEVRMTSQLKDFGGPLIARCETICSRNEFGDAAYVCLVLDMLFKVGMASETGYAFVKDLRGKWEGFASTILKGR